MKEMTKKTRSGSVFTFNYIKKKDVMKIKNLDTFKASQENDIPTKIIKENTIFSNFIHQSFNNMIDICIFFNIFLQLANMAPVFRKRTRKSNGKLRTCKQFAKYIKNLQKVSFNKCQITLKTYFSKFQNGFGPGLNAQYCLMCLINVKSLDKGKSMKNVKSLDKGKSMKNVKSLGKGKPFAALITYLTKALNEIWKNQDRGLPPIWTYQSVVCFLMFFLSQFNYYPLV